MTKHEFIFSEDRKYRRIRHITFWLVWLFAYFLFFHIPLHAIFGWNLSAANRHIQEFGGWWVLKMLIFNCLLAVVLPQMLFTYTLLYVILPRYFYQKRRFLETAVVVVLFLMGYLVVSGCLKTLAVLPNYVLGLVKNYVWPDSRSFFVALRDTLTSLPVIVGLALMVKLIKRWWIKEQETKQIADEKVKAEVQLLKAQVHPHFLFNTLNNIYFFILAGSPQAPEIIKKLSDLLKYILNDCNVDWVPLEKEIKMLEDYIALEQIRYGDHIDLLVDMPKSKAVEKEIQGKWLIAPLLLIPFVENSFKHGASKMLNRATIRLHLLIEGDMLHLSVTNNRPLEQEISSQNRQSMLVSGKIGLNNVKKRLELLYPDAHELNIISMPDDYTVHLRIKLRDRNKLNKVHQKQKKGVVYDRA